MEIEQLVIKTMSALDAPNYLQLMEGEVETGWREFFQKRPLIRSISFDEQGKKIDFDQKMHIKNTKSGAYLSVSKDKKVIYLESCDFRESSFARPIVWSVPLA